MSKPLRIGIAGLGTVGVGTFSLLRCQARLITERCGRQLKVTAVTARDQSRDRGIDLSGIRWAGDPVELACSKDIDVFVELIGGESGAAREAVEKALDAGKTVVTANKALIAHHGIGLARLSEKSGANLYFEAAVAGGIPIVKALRDSLAANAVSRIYGIINGTCNYILTKMENTGRDFGDVLREAQDLGYAESDPTFDIDGIDTAHKLAILTSVAFGVPVDIDSVHTEGIRHISSIDISYARKLGFRIKLLGTVLKTSRGLEQRVHPCMIPDSSSMARIEGVSNAVFVEGDYVGPIIFEGSGAGAKPTSSAVVSDIIDAARGISIPAFGVPTERLISVEQTSAKERLGPWYIRLEVLDRPGVLADIAARLRDNSVSIETVLQRGRDPEERVSVILTTHEAREDNFASAIRQIQDLEALEEPPCMIRIENF